MNNFNSHNITRKVCETAAFYSMLTEDGLMIESMMKSLFKTFDFWPFSEVLTFAPFSYTCLNLELPLSWRREVVLDDSAATKYCLTDIDNL